MHVKIGILSVPPTAKVWPHSTWRLLQPQSKGIHLELRAELSIIHVLLVLNWCKTPVYTKVLEDSLRARQYIAGLCFLHGVPKLEICEGEASVPMESPGC